jgi:hypothetical protein
MNKRIKELALQTGLSEGVFTRHDGVPCDLKGYSMTPEQMKKFAELIVEECAGIADIERDTSAGCGYVTQTAGQRIKQHFGIE